MPASINHLVVGEIVWKKLYSDWPAEIQGAFLAGCLLVDVHGFNDIDRRCTHFVGRVEEDGEIAFQQSCTNFLHEVDNLMKHPWSRLTPIEKFFVAGYLCHLAVDECWKKLGWQLFQRFGITSWDDFPVAADVNVITFDFLSRGQWIDPPELGAVLENIIIPDVFTHVPVEVFRKQWYVSRDYVAAGGTPEAYFGMLERAGRSSSELAETRQRYEKNWDMGIDFIYEIGGVIPFIKDAVERTRQVLPQLKDFGSLTPPLTNR